MRLHIQNPTDDPVFSITREQWNAAVRRNPLAGPFEVTISDDPDRLGAELAGADILLTWVSIVARQLTAVPLRTLAPRLKIIACTSAGVDRLAPFDWLPADVALLNNSGTHGEKAGEFGIMALLMLQNRMPELIRSQQAGEWRQAHGSTLRGRTLCVVGMGSLGGGVARQARAFGMHVLGVRNGSGKHPDCDETFQADGLKGALARADDVLLACPLTAQTRNLLSRDRIGLLRKGARAVNIARGPVWDQEAVCDALEAGHLESAFTDVTVPEPLDPAHRLWRTRGIIVTPHVSADDREKYNDHTLDIFLRNVIAFQEGAAMPNRVDPARGY
jgi:glyoxylate/hydroxypyruvate reductase A